MVAESRGSRSLDGEARARAVLVAGLRHGDEDHLGQVDDGRRHLPVVAPEEAAALIDAVSTEQTPEAQLILERFVSRYRSGF